MKRQICLALSVLFLLSLLCLSVGAETPPDEVVFDRAKLFDDAELRTVKESVLAAWESADCAFYVATHKSSTTTYEGDQFLRDHGLSQNQTIVLLVITLDSGEYFYNIYTYGKAYSKIRNAEINYILDHDDVFPNLKGGKLAAGIEACMALSATAYEGRVGVSYAIILSVALIIALIIGIIACISVHASYKMKRRSVDYPLERFAKLQLTDQSDVFTGSFVTKRYIQTNSGGRGGRGSSHGGGGGHRGGR